MSRIQVLGIPSHAGSRQETSHAIDQHSGPSAIRKAYERLMSGFDIPQHLEDIGDVAISNTVVELLTAVDEGVSKIYGNGCIPIILGGVHTLTVGSLRALARKKIDYSLIYLDSHPDLMPHPELNYGSSLYYAIQEGVLNPKRVALIGIRQVEQAEWKLIRDLGIFYLEANDFENYTLPQIIALLKEKMPAPYFVSLDLDVLDPSFAPGVTSPVPAGLAPREVVYLVNELCKLNVIGLELVELSPINDVKDQTSRACAMFLQSFSTAINQYLERQKA